MVICHQQQVDKKISYTHKTYLFLDFASAHAVSEPTLDFGLVGGYKNVQNHGKKRVLSDDDDSVEEDEIINITRRNGNKNDSKKKKGEKFI
jgi:hypothetical protein